MKFVNKHCYHIFVLTHDSICYVFKYRMIDGVSSFCKCQAVLCPLSFESLTLQSEIFAKCANIFCNFTSYVSGHEILFVFMLVDFWRRLDCRIIQYSRNVWFLTNCFDFSMNILRRMIDWNGFFFINFTFFGTIVSYFEFTRYAK